MTDFLQKRYSCSDTYLFDEISAERFFSLVYLATETAAKEMQDKHRQDLKNHAFHAFLQGAGGEMDYESYLIRIGLHEALEMEKDITAEEAIEKGRSILKMLGN